MSLRQTLVSQFRRPSGGLGAVAGWVMANRPSNRRRNAWTVGLLQPPPNGRVLEWGCGPGLGIEDCLRRWPDVQVIAVDHSPVMVAQAQRRNAPAVARGRARILLGQLAEAAALAPFDAMFSCNVLQFAPDQAEALRTVAHLLAPGGVAASTFQPRARGATADDAWRWADRIAADYTAAGFFSVRVETLPLRPVPAVCVLGSRLPH